MYHITRDWTSSPVGKVHVPVHARVAFCLLLSTRLRAIVCSFAVSSICLFPNLIGFWLRQARLKYYFCWCLSHTALKCSGAAYLGRASGRDMWQRGENVRPLGVELATSSVEYPLNWNICTGASLNPSRHASHRCGRWRV